jgi:hypothetical protein
VELDKRDPQLLPGCINDAQIAEKRLDDNGNEQQLSAQFSKSERPNKPTCPPMDKMRRSLLRVPTNMRSDSFGSSCRLVTVSEA